MLLRYSRTALLAAGFFAYAQAFFHYSRRSEAPAIIPDQVKGKTKPVTRAMSAGSSSRCGSCYQPLLSGIQDSKLKTLNKSPGDGIVYPRTDRTPARTCRENEYMRTNIRKKVLTCRIFSFREMLQFCNIIFSGSGIDRRVYV